MKDCFGKIVDGDRVDLGVDGRSDPRLALGAGTGRGVADLGHGRPGQRLRVDRRVCLQLDLQCVLRGRVPARGERRRVHRELRLQAVPALLERVQQRQVCVGDGLVGVARDVGRPDPEAPLARAVVVYVALAGGIDAAVGLDRGDRDRLAHRRLRRVRELVRDARPDVVRGRSLHELARELRGPALGHADEAAGPAGKGEVVLGAEALLAQAVLVLLGGEPLRRVGVAEVLDGGVPGDLRARLVGVRAEAEVEPAALRDVDLLFEGARLAGSTQHAAVQLGALELHRDPHARTGAPGRRAGTGVRLEHGLRGDPHPAGVRRDPAPHRVDRRGQLAQHLQGLLQRLVDGRVEIGDVQWQARAGGVVPAEGRHTGAGVDGAGALEVVEPDAAAPGEVGQAVAVGVGEVPVRPVPGATHVEHPDHAEVGLDAAGDTELVLLGQVDQTLDRVFLRERDRLGQRVLRRAGVQPVPEPRAPRRTPCRGGCRR